MLYVLPQFQAHIPLESQSKYQIYSHPVLAYSTHIWAIAGNVKQEDVVYNDAHKMSVPKYKKCFKTIIRNIELQEAQLQTFNNGYKGLG